MSGSTSDSRGTCRCCFLLCLLGSPLGLDASKAHFDELLVLGEVLGADPYVLNELRGFDVVRVAEEAFQLPIRQASGVASWTAELPKSTALRTVIKLILHGHLAIARVGIEDPKLTCAIASATHYQSTTFAHIALVTHVNLSGVSCLAVRQGRCQGETSSSNTSAGGPLLCIIVSLSMPSNTSSASSGGDTCCSSQQRRDTEQSTCREGVGSNLRGSSAGSNGWRRGHRIVATHCRVHNKCCCLETEHVQARSAKASRMALEAHYKTTGCNGEDLNS
mmetsp:Transcript_10769/g.24601  ORF Transcript_10769/g.24601 Transcript_10769/m.24601 type:complete len:277 (-) Transcript_10769:7-837(-)